MREIELEISGYPPAKGEAISMLGAGHSHASRVTALLEAARSAIEREAASFGSTAIGVELVVRCPRDSRRGDATNYLGGIGDVLENKAHRRGARDHLGALASTALYDNDRQIEEILYRFEEASEPSYRLRIWSLDS